jgi:hypothetical protein
MQLALVSKVGGGGNLGTVAAFSCSCTFHGRTMWIAVPRTFVPGPLMWE